MNCKPATVFALTIGLMWASVSYGQVDFAHQVAPILKEHCVECHGGTRAEGGFSVNTRELMLDSGVATPGEPGDGYLLELITSSDTDWQMPPEGKARVPQDQVDTLKRWIAEGMPWTPGLTFAADTYQPPLAPRRPELPPGDAQANPIDRILAAHLAAEGDRPQPPVEDAAYYRRVSLDLVGLLPPPEEVARFVADDSPDKRRRLVSRLLADDTAYTEHWTTFWNDLLRNDYVGVGYISGGRRNISGWLYQALLENKPYDQMVRELIVPTKGATGFSYGIKWRGEVNASQEREVQFAQSVGQVFLGINLKCASCHDSFIDRWTLEETYNLGAVYATRPLELHRCDKPTGQTAKAAWLFPELGEIDPDAPQEARLGQLAELLTHPENGRLARTMVNRLWHQLMGRGIVYPVDAMQTRPWNEDLLDYLATDLADHGYDLKHTLRRIATSDAYASQAVRLERDPDETGFTYRGPLPKRMTAEQYVDAIWQITGIGAKQPHERIAKTLTALEPAHPSPDWYRASMVQSDLLMRSLGRPNREQIVSTRPNLLTTLQALDLSNSPTMVELIESAAASMVDRHQADPPGQIVDSLYLASLARQPTGAERAIALELLGTPLTQQGMQDLLWAVFMLPEFQIIR